MQNNNPWARAGSPALWAAHVLDFNPRYIHTLAGESEQFQGTVALRRTNITHIYRHQSLYFRHLPSRISVCNGYYLWKADRHRTVLSTAPCPAAVVRGPKIHVTVDLTKYQAVCKQKNYMKALGPLIIYIMQRLRIFGRIEFLTLLAAFRL
jgi:hypothetical protein